MGIVTIIRMLLPGFLALLPILFLALVVHELAHLCALWRYLGYRPTFSLRKGLFWAGRLEDYQQLTGAQQYMVYASGFVTGAIVITVWGLFWLPAFAALIPYMAASWHDLRNMWHIAQEENV